MRSDLVLALVASFPLLALAACTPNDDAAKPVDTGAEPADTDLGADTDTTDTGDTDPTDTDDTDTTDTGDTADTDTGGPCWVVIDRTLPAADAMDAYYRGRIEVELSDPDPTAVLSGDFPGTFSTPDGGTTLYLTPSDPLAPDTTYSVTVTWCGGVEAFSFTTSSLGTPIGDPAALVGRVYAFGLDDVRVTAPAGIGSVLAGYLTSSVLLRVTAADDRSLTLLAAAVEEGGTRQDTSFETRSIVADFGEQPYAVTGVLDLSLPVVGVAAPVGGAVLSGTFAADGSYIGGVSGSGTIDTRPLGVLVGEAADPGAFCDLALSFGATCEACPGDSEPYCLGFAFDQGTARPSSERVAEVTSGTSCATGAAPLGGAAPLVGVGLLLALRRRARRGSAT